MRAGIILTISATLLIASCSGDDDDAAPASTSSPLPTPVSYRDTPDGVTLADPEFVALPGATADFGRLGGAAYQIEMPDNWNGQLVMYIHGYEELEPEAEVTAPDMRRYLVAHGYAWGASSFSSTSLIPGRAADETAALWDYFARTYGRPERSYVTGLSMGGMATNIAAERYPDRFDGALALCGAASHPAAMQIGSDFFLAAAYAAGVTQSEYDAEPDTARLVRERVRPALDDPTTHALFESVLVDLTGGAREFDRAGIHVEETTNWARVELLAAARLLTNRDGPYELGSTSGVTSETFNEAVLRLDTNEEALEHFVQGGDTTGELRMPLISLHTTGDGQVPISQARVLHERVEGRGKGELLVERVIRDPGHCGFTTTEVEAAFEALTNWVETGEQPDGSDVTVNDLRTIERTFELQPREGSAAANEVPGASERVVLRGTLTLDAAPLTAEFLGAVVRHDGFVTPCQYTLPPVDAGRYEITVMADAESAGCGAPGREVLLWTFANETKLWATAAVPWPESGNAVDVDVAFASATPNGVARETQDFTGEVYTQDGRHVLNGARVEAFVGDTLCGVASVRWTGGYTGYIIAIAGEDSIPGCTRGATVRFTVDGKPVVDTVKNERGRQEALDLTLK